MPQQVIVIENGQEFNVETQSEVEHFVGSEMTVTYKGGRVAHYVVRQIAINKDAKKVLIVDVLDEQALYKRKVNNFSRIKSLSF